MIKDYLDVYLKSKPPDCIVYSQDGIEFKIQKEILSQTCFLREILSSAKGHCCGIIEIFCPCTRNELENMLKFLNRGEIYSEKESDLIKTQENLCKIFGFPENLSINNPNQSLSADQNRLLDIEFVEVEEKTETLFDENDTPSGMNRMHYFVTMASEYLGSCKNLIISKQF